MPARVSALYISPAATVLPHAVSEAEARAHRGLVGDRYFAGVGTFSDWEPKGPGRELTLVESEVIAELGLSAADLRRNIVTEGVRLNQLVGKRFRIGEVLVEGIRLCPPCTHLDQVTGRALLKLLAERGGLRADILSDGVIQVGDLIAAEPYVLTGVSPCQLDQLVDVLEDCVACGAVVSFINPFSRQRGLDFWQRVADDVETKKRILLVAEDEQGICGTVQLVFDLPENQPHRAELVKMLVHRRARRQGLGERLMRAAEEAARAAGKSLLMLNTVTDGGAARLYERLGWVRIGDVPDFALYPDGGLSSTTYYYRKLT